MELTKNFYEKRLAQLLKRRDEISNLDAVYYSGEEKIYNSSGVSKTVPFQVSYKQYFDRTLEIFKERARG